MPHLRRAVPSGERQHGGILGYPSEQLAEEVAFIAYHLHWPLGDILALEHGDRRAWVAEVSKINRARNEEA